MNSFTFNSVDMTSYGVTVIKTPFAAISVPITDVQQSAYGIGTSYYQTFSPKTFSINCLISGTNSSNLHNNIDYLAASIITSTEANLSFDTYFPNRYWKSRYIGGLETIEYLNDKNVLTNLQFISPNPFAYDISSYDITGINISSTSFDWSSSANLFGNAPTNPTIEIICNAATSSISIFDFVSNSSLYFTGSLSTGNRIRFNGENYTATKSINDGTSWTNVMNSVTGNFPKLKGGQINYLAIYGVPSGSTMKISYNPRYY